MAVVVVVVVVMVRVSVLDAECEGSLLRQMKGGRPKRLARLCPRVVWRALPSFEGRQVALGQRLALH